MSRTFPALKRCSLLVALLALGGCVFAPSARRGSDAAGRTVAPVPDASADRLPKLDTEHIRLRAPNQEVVGAVQVLFAHYENTFATIARAYDVGYDALTDANPGVDQWLPGEGTPVYLPTAFVLPDAPRDGIVLNLPSMRLMYFTREAAQLGGDSAEALEVTTHPIGIGRQGWETPTGQASVTGRARDPAWYVPASVRAEHSERGDPLPRVVPPGPDNPLGRFALTLSLPGYLIHGTNKPAGVGMRVSHGCIRLYPEDIAELFRRVPDGTPVHIVNQPVLAGWRSGVLYLEVHGPLAEDHRDLKREADRVLAAALAGAPGGGHVELNERAVAKVVAEHRGMPFPVSAGSASPRRYLASSRVVENDAPIPAGQPAAARVD